MITQEIASFPHYEDSLKELVEQHRQLEDWPLLLAVYYAPERQPQDVFLLEVVHNFGEGQINPYQTLFEVQYGSTEGFPMAPGQYLHLVMANPAELEVALREDWLNAREIRRALNRKQAHILYDDSPEASGLEDLLRG